MATSLNLALKSAHWLLKHRTAGRGRHEGSSPAILEAADDWANETTLETSRVSYISLTSGHRSCSALCLWYQCGPYLDAIGLDSDETSSRSKSLSNV